MLKKMIIIAIIGAMALSIQGCGGQTGGGELKLLGINREGLQVGVIKTKGISVAAGGKELVSHLNDNFNATVERKDKLEVIDKGMEKGVIKNAEEVKGVYKSIFGN